LGSAASKLPTGVSKLPFTKKHPILPPGAGNLKRFQQRCTACHLCITKCPDHAIRPAISDYGLKGFLKPVMSFENGYCIFDCVICTQVCPNHALLPINMEEKHHLQIGKVAFIQENCVVDSQRTNCGACAEHCPTGAATMVPFGNPEEALTIPKIDADLCIGCGACEYICPVRPYRAIYVDGNPVHLESKPAFDPTEKQQEIKLDAFGF
jgi:ferredoxin